MNHSDEVDELDGQLHAEPGLRAFVEDVRAYASGPPPVVRSDLAAVLAGGVGAAAGRDEPVVIRPGRAEGLLGRVLGGIQGRRGRLALGASVLGLSVLGTGGAGALPGPAQDVFQRTVEAVGIELPEEVRRIDDPTPQGPSPQEPSPQEPTPHAPLEGGAPDGHDRPQPPPPRDDRRPDSRPGQDGPTSPTTPRSIPPEGRGGAGSPGSELRREPGGDRPASPPTTPAPPVSPPRPGPPGASPGAAPDGAPAGGPEDDAELGGRPAQPGADAQQGTGAQARAELRTSASPTL